jgi:NAD(P)H-hydrate epimerase
MDAEAASAWFFDPFALVEAAGRRAAGVLLKAFPSLFAFPGGPRIAVLAGSGNNAADALVILRALILAGRLEAGNAAVLIHRIPGPGERNPRSEAFRSLEKMGVRVFPVAADPDPALDEMLCREDLLIDGIAGTGLEGPLGGSLAALVERVNRLAALAGREKRPLVVSVDLPSGNSDHWKEGDPVLSADATLAIEPEKFCLYNPALRPRAGRILSVGCIFPRPLTEKYRAAELVSWDQAAPLIPPVKQDAYKYSRGLLEIRAGSPGGSGAAWIAARGAQAAGAGLIRLVADPQICGPLASCAGGIMVVPAETGGETLGIGVAPGGSRFKPHVVLLGPGWGRSPARRQVLEEALTLEEAGIPLILDADAIGLAKGRVFHGRVLLTPHPGELAAYADIPKEELLAHPAPLLLSLAREKKAVILFKTHVMFAAAPDGRLGLVDGMAPVLGAGGSGDLLAGFCAGIAARLWAAVPDVPAPGSAVLLPETPQPPDLYACALAAAALLIRTAKDPLFTGRFADPLELADKAAGIAGKAWLPFGTDPPNPFGGTNE